MPETEPAAVTDAAECRCIGIEAWETYSRAIVDRRPLDMDKIGVGDLVLEITTAFRWLGNPMAAPGEALGWLLRVEEGESTYDRTYVLRPIYEPPGVEFSWSNAKFILADATGVGDNDE